LGKAKGMGGEDAAGKIPDDFEAKAKQTLNNVGAVLKAAGMSSDNVVSVQVYLTDVATFERMNVICRAYFKEPRPTRTTVGGLQACGAGPHRDYGYVEEVGNQVPPKPQQLQQDSRCANLISR
jgi:enamine deaminase RidA (YjgF/YER057c/UK114 family)